MPALAIRDDIGSEELRLRARRESDGRVSARLIAGEARRVRQVGLKHNSKSQ